MISQQTSDTIRSFRKIPLIIIAIVLALIFVWPFYSVPTGSRGVITQFGRIVGIEGEGLAVLLPGKSCRTSASDRKRLTSITPKAARATSNLSASA